jgi:NTE family protein
MPLTQPRQGGNPQLPFECVALLLQGGGALGAYQAGVYEGLSEAGIIPNWVAGINAAIIAGSPPDKGVDHLRRFWRQVTQDARAAWPEGF